MAIVKSSSFGPSPWIGGDSSSESRDSFSGDESDDSTGDSSTSSDSGVDEAGTELCQVGNDTISLPLELHDLRDLTPILNLETWNEVLSEEERFALCKFLPDMDQLNFAQTLKELFSGKDFHFRNPLSELFTKLKGGALDPKAVLYSRGLNTFKKREHYHSLRMYQNAMVGSLRKMRDAWADCSRYAIEEKLRLFNILRSQRSSDNEVWEGRRLDMDQKLVKFGKDNVEAKGNLRTTPPEVSMKAGKKGSYIGLPPYDKKGRTVDQRVTVASYNPQPLETMSRTKYSGKDWMYPPKDWSQCQWSMGSQPNKSEEWNVRSKKLKSEIDSGNRMSKDGFDPNSYRSLPALVGDPYLYADDKLKARQAKIMSKYANDARNAQHAETESDSSEGDLYYFAKKVSRSGVTEGQQRGPGFDLKRNMKPYYTKVKQKHKTTESNLDQFSEDNVGSGRMSVSQQYLDGNSRIFDRSMQANSVGDEYNVAVADRVEKSKMSIVMCSSTTNKRKGKADGRNEDEMEYFQSGQMLQTNDSNFIKKKTKTKADASGSPSLVATPDTIIPGKGIVAEPEAKPLKKQFTLITPTKHTGFSFSIIHLLTAVRKAMFIGENDSHLEQNDVTMKEESEENKILMAVNATRSDMDMDTSEEARHAKLPSLTLQEIVSRVRTSPGDPCIIETEEPLQDLIRGVLKIFTSKTPPLGAKDWKVLVSYDKSNKSWCWVGPASTSSDTDMEETSPEAWGIAHKMLVKLVDAFANWLKSGQEILRQIGSLPPPPTELLPELDEKQRFRDLKAQKSLNTINPSSDEVRAYFRREELLRYLLPDRVFSYTAADGKKSIVAPLRRGGGKPTSKARDHFMLKPDRPPHVTILCLVRDAAARLPGSIGTRADVCTLIRDSQYIVEDVSDAQVTQVVSGALDRLHYERDPCVQFDSERKLWVYLHRDREEEDFDEEGTSSTKKWKRQRNPSDAPVTDNGDPTAASSSKFDLNPDLNVGPSSFQSGMNNEPIYDGIKSSIENFQSFVDQSADDKGQGNRNMWEALGLNVLKENQTLCSEKSTNKDVEDNAFSRERPVGILSANK